jgi:FkbM family methyltransferase
MDSKIFGKILLIFYYFFIDVYNKIPFETALRRFILRIANTNGDFNKLMSKIFLIKLETIIKLPRGIKVYLTDFAEMIDSIDRLFIHKEYFHFPEFIPKRDWIILDIGANLGWVALFYAKITQKGLVIAIEPNPYALSILKANCSLNHVGNLKIIEVALSDNKGIINLYLHPKNKITRVASFYEEHVKKFAYTKETHVIQVITITLDDLLKELKLKKVDLVKIDTEGAELQILKGSINSLKSKKISKLIIEVHKDITSVKEVLDFLKSLKLVFKTKCVDYNNKAILYISLD